MTLVAVVLVKSLALESGEASRFQWEEPGPWESGAGECTDIAEHEAITTDHYTILSLEQEEILIKNQNRSTRIRSWKNDRRRRITRSRSRKNSRRRRNQSQEEEVVTGHIRPVPPPKPTFTPPTYPLTKESQGGSNQWKRRRDGGGPCVCVCV